jgi:hypothetical protein
MSNEPADTPPFHSIKGALAFAFNFSHGSVKKPFLASLAGASKPGRGLSGLDGAGQAGLIRAAVHELKPAVREQIIIGRFAPRQASLHLPARVLRGLRPQLRVGASR